jgi:PP-loop superfamily ATP-utilizing enzyme
VIIDLSEWMKAERKPPAAEGATVDESQAQPQRPDPKVTMETVERWKACPHKTMSIDDKQRTVKCGDCKMWLEPVWCLRELFRYYEERVDRRVKEIEEFERRQKEIEDRKRKRKEKPRAARAETMRENLERAAYNEYQAKVLAARAAHQRLTAEKIERELTDSRARGEGEE